MKYILTLLLIPACSMFDKTPEVTIPTPVRNCVQQVEPKNPAIPCKIGDWFAEGDAKCSSTEAICLKKRF